VDSEQGFKLRGLDAAATYEFKDLDTGKAAQYSGTELVKCGLPVAVSKPQQAALLNYRRLAN